MPFPILLVRWFGFIKNEISQLDIIWETAGMVIIPSLYDYLPLRSVVAEHHQACRDGDHIVQRLVVILK